MIPCNLFYIRQVYDEGTVALEQVSCFQDLGFDILNGIANQQTDDLTFFQEPGIDIISFRFNTYQI